jgi:hypothetical protein
MKLTASVLLLALTSSTALAEDKSLVMPCFDIAAIGHNSAETGVALMVNKCTGETWYLGRTIGADKAGNITNYSYQWFPLHRAP